MKEIVSTKNQFIKEIKKLHTLKGRNSANQYLIEGFHLLEEAANAGKELDYIFFTHKAQEQWASWLTEQNEDKKFLVSQEVMNQISTLPTSQGIAGVLQMEENILPARFSGRWLLLDQVQDPGNVGTMIRTADAAGFAGVVLGEGSADIYNSKVLRSMQGSNFHLPIYQADLRILIEKMKETNITIYGTELNEAALPLKQVPASRENLALIMGNEGAGVAKDLLEMTHANIYIELKGRAESLNVAIAAGVLMFHFS